MTKRDWELLHRRTFMKAAAGFGGSMMLGAIPFKAFAQATNLAPADRCFVFAYFSGGWDVLLSLDPRDPAVFTPDRSMRSISEHETACRSTAGLSTGHSSTPSTNGPNGCAGWARSPTTRRHGKPMATGRRYPWIPSASSR